MDEHVDHLSRPQAIERIRHALEIRSDDDHCACAIAARFGSFCKGLSRFSDKELRDRLWFISRTRPGASRQELERLASLYHLGRQEVTGASICCDLETKDRCACDGWNSFDNPMLEKFCRELTGRAIHIE